MSVDLNELIEKNGNCEFCECKLCSNRCRDCRYIEMDNDFYNDGTRRCSYKGRWVRPGDAACGNFSY